MVSSAVLLREARTRAGLTQREVSRRTGVTVSVISAYENGRREPGGDTLLRLLEGAGASVTLHSTVEASRTAAAALERVCALAMALPRRQPGALLYPSLRHLQFR